MATMVFLHHGYIEWCSSKSKSLENPYTLTQLLEDARGAKNGYLGQSIGNLVNSW